MMMDVSSASLFTPSDLVSKERKLATDYAAVFFSKIFASQFEAIDTDGIMGGGEGEEMFRSFLVDEYGKIVAKSDPTFLTKSIEKQLLKFQEVDYDH